MTRVLLKLSGEALGGGSGTGIDPQTVTALCKEVAAVHAAGAEVGLVLGAGNLVRGAALEAAGMDRVSGDHIGMLGTVMNALAMAGALQQQGLKTQVYSAFGVPGIAEQYRTELAQASLDAGKICLFAGGLGNPLFTTDTAAVLRGIEIKADMVLKATKVDGVYSADPQKDPTATRYDDLTYDAVIQQNLQVMDLTAICLCRDHEMPLVVFDMNQQGALTRILKGDKVGTTIRSTDG